MDDLLFKVGDMDDIYWNLCLGIIMNGTTVIKTAYCDTFEQTADQI